MADGRAVSGTGMISPQNPVKTKLKSLKPKNLQEVIDFARSSSATNVNGAAGRGNHGDGGRAVAGAVVSPRKVVAGSAR